MAEFHKILIANRGEIAVRIIKAARRMGYRTVAVYSEADARALHVTLADEAVCIGPASVSESYLMTDAILAGAAATGADAVHPGYGFLSENADFARACEKAGLVFIGPDAASIELMGSKRQSKQAMLAAGVPCVPGYPGAAVTDNLAGGPDDEMLLQAADSVGFPLMVKASAGGGGRGMRLVENPADLRDQLKAARSEALGAFGCDELILERALIGPRHIEIQIFADRHGQTVHLFERDCSVQRRHQKVIEEAPSPFVGDDLRERMGKAAVAAAKACGYCGAGTVEFLVDADSNFYFLEMNTRLQVEHPVTEMITGLDLVEWQILVASGHRLPLGQNDITRSGHAVEVRLYAEDPRQDFMPQTGHVLGWHVPLRDGVRTDHSIMTGQVVSPHYDPMLAKIIAHGPDRATAVRRLASAVQDTVLLGVNHNKLFLQNILRHPVFLAGAATTAFIGQDFANDASLADTRPGIGSFAHAALLYFIRSGGGQAPWHSAAARQYRYKIQYAGKEHDCELTQKDDIFTISMGAKSISLTPAKPTLAEQTPDTCCFVVNGVRKRCMYAFDGPVLHLDDGCGHFSFTDVTHAPAASVAAAGNGHLTAPMDGAVIDVRAADGDIVKAGETLIVMEAMKMEHALKASVSGKVSGLSVTKGAQVKTKQILALIQAPEENGS